MTRPPLILTEYAKSSPIELTVTQRDALRDLVRGLIIISILVLWFADAERCMRPLASIKPYPTRPLTASNRHASRTDGLVGAEP